MGAELRGMTMNNTDLAGSAPTVPLPWDWSFEPLVCLLLVALCAVYIAGLWRQARERRLPKDAALRALSFACAVAMLVLALMSPLDAWGDELFAGHMAQHLILMMVAPPLLVLARPVVVGLWALPRARRHALAAWWLGSPAARPLDSLVRSPIAAWLLVSAALWFWHLPKPYALAFHYPAAHALEHLSFFLSSILFWRIVIGGPSTGRISTGAVMIFLLTFAMQNAMLAAILIFSPRVLYAVHSVAPPWSPWTPIEDQQVAGILMWSVTGAIDLLALSLLFVAWLASSSQRMQRT